MRSLTGIRTQRDIRVVRLVREIKTQSSIVRQMIERWVPEESKFKDGDKVSNQLPGDREVFWIDGAWRQKP